MNRDTLKDGLDKGFGSPEYAREELRAEISAMMTGERVGVGHDPQRGAAYVENWVAVLEKDPHEIHRAARDAQQNDRLPDGPCGRARARSAGQGEDGGGVEPPIFSRSRASDQPDAEAIHGTTRAEAPTRGWVEPVRSRRVRSARPSYRSRRTVTRSRRDPAKEREQRGRDGHRREYDPRTERKNFQDRTDRAVADLGMYRSVAYRDLADAHFDGHPYAARRAVDRMVRAGHVREHSAEGPQGGAYKVLTLTERGSRAGRAGSPRTRTGPGTESMERPREARRAST